MASRVVVLASGGGTNCQALIDACADDRLDAEIVAVISNNKDAGALARAHAAEIPAEVVAHRGSDPETRKASDDLLIERIAAYNPNLVVLAGWMRILGPAVGAAFPMINLHPALPGAFAGLRAIERAFAAWEADEIQVSGVMVHWVPDGGVDDGPVIDSVTVPFEAGDSLSDFEARLHAAEHRLIVSATGMALVNLA